MAPETDEALEHRVQVSSMEEPFMIARVGAVLLIAVLAGAVPAGSQSVPLVEKKAIGLAAAKKMVAAAEAEALKNKWAISISVVDDDGNLVYFERMDGTNLPTVAVSQGKARTAAQYRTATKGFEERLSKGETQLLSLPNATELRGGLPVLVDGQVVGAIAGSGAKGEQDEQCAQAGIDALMK
jgi:glc operon protein GlcG